MSWTILVMLALICAPLPGMGPALASAQDYSPVGSPSPELCIKHHTQAQELLIDGRLLESIEALQKCLHPGCSPILRSECAALLPEVEAQTPTVIFSATANGQELSEVQVLEGDTVLATRLDGLPLRLDPGRLELRFVAEEHPEATKQILLNTGELSRVVSVQLQTESPVEPAGDAASPAVAADGPNVSRRRANPPLPSSHKAPPQASSPLTALLFGFGLAFGAGGAVVGALAKSDYDRSKSECAPLCTNEDSRGVFTKSVVADGLFVLSAATLTYATIRLFTATEHGDPIASIHLGPSSIRAEGRF